MQDNSNTNSPRNFRDLTGQVFGRLTVLYRIPNTGQKSRAPRWLCLCTCSNQTSTNSHALVSGQSKSCGCLHKEIVAQNIRERSLTHGMSHTKEHDTWLAMKGRCFNPNNTRSEEYAGRGITVCQGLMVFEHFLSVLGRAPSPKHSIDRAANNDSYTCGQCAECAQNGWILNVRWATPTMQVRNRRVTPMLKWNNIELSVAEWAEQLGKSYSALNSRVLRGWDTTRIFTQPFRASRNPLN